MARSVRSRRKRHENRKVGLYKQRLQTQTGYTFNAIGAETYTARSPSTPSNPFAI